MRSFKKIALIVVMLLLVSVMFVGCIKPYNKPEFITIEPSQTAFLIPLVGNTNQQGTFESEEMLSKAKVATKEIQIPKRWVQTGRAGWVGEWRPSARVVVVERKPETREWTEDTTTGTSSANQGIMAESKESIGFMARMNCSAQIDEVDAVCFLYRYNNKSLAGVMDTEIRARVESTFVEICSALTMEEILVNKTDIMNKVRTDAETFFKERGITITVLGLKGEVTYNDPKIQEAINARFKAVREQEAQTTINETNVKKAEAEKQAKIAQAEAEAQAIKLVQETLETSPQYIDYIKWSKWDGVLPAVMADGNGLILDVGEANK
jgi:regulator of protease activity HflC (stomatin/prohibitin superfamily)